MQPQNYTPIDDLIKKLQAQSDAAIKPTPESEPLLSKPTEPLSVSEPTQEESEKEQDVTNYIEVKKEHVEVPPELKKIGVENDEPIDLTVDQNMKLPLADDKILPGLHAPLSTSLRWLAEFSLFLLKHVHLTLKVICGKVRRVRI